MHRGLLRSREATAGTILVGALALSTLVAVPAEATTACNTAESTLVSAIQTSTSLSTITSAASGYRSCLSRQADSLNSVPGSLSTAGGAFYSIMTSATTYNWVGRSFALRAAYDYRFVLTGEESTVNTSAPSNCAAVYQTLIAQALSVGDVALGSKGATASRECVSARSVPPNTVTVNPSGPVNIGQTLTGATQNWPSGVTLSSQWLRNGSVISGATSARYVTTASDAGAVLTYRVTASRSGLSSASKSAPGVSVRAAQLTSTPTPTIQGTAAVGQTVLAATGQWDSGVTFTYQWLRNGSAISGATRSTYTIGSTDLSARLSAQVTGSKDGSQSVTKTSSSVSVAAGTLTLSPTPTISGSSQVGSALSALVGTWDSGVSFSYQWLRGGTEISGARTATYTTGQSDAGQFISVRVTGSKPGYTSVIRTSAGLTVDALRPLTLTPIPTVSGTARVGNTLTATAGVWDTGVSLSYQWLSNGEPIPGAIGTTYLLTPGDGFQLISVRVTGSRLGYVSASQSSVAVQIQILSEFTLMPVPTISGTFVTDHSLSVDTGTWDSGATLSIAWLRNGSPIAGANGTTYLLTPADATYTVSVRVTASKDGYTTISRTSAGTNVSLGTLTLQPAPSVHGSFRVGETLTLDPGEWDAGVKVSVQWRRNGLAIQGATGLSYTPTAADGLQLLSASVVGSKAGYSSVEATIDPTLVELASLSPAPTPTINGTFQVNYVLTAVPGTWPSGTALSYQWLRNGEPILNATGSTRTLTSDDIGQLLSVRVTGSKAGYQTVQRVSTAQTVVDTPALTLTPTPTFGDVAQVGRTLLVAAGTWDAGVRLSYQWLRNGVAISGATSLMYVPVAADFGQDLSVQVTGSKTGYASAVRSSPSVRVQAGALTATPTPTITGTAKVTNVVTAVAGNWDSGTKLTYQWVRDGSPISGATDVRYTLTTADALAALSVQVTGTKPGYSSVTRSSASTVVALGTFVSTPAPTVFGTFLVGSTLTSTVPAWDSGVALTMQWLRNGVAIPNATGSSYVLTADDQGTYISLQVTGSKSGYQTAARNSNGGYARLTQVLNFSLPAKLNGGATPYSLTATATSGLPVLYTVSTPTICAISNGMLTMLATGTCTIVASQPGNTSYVAASSVQQSTVLSKTKTTTRLTASTTTPRVDQSVILTATVSAAAGESTAGQTVRFYGRASQFTSVTFEIGTAITDANGVATLTTSFSSVQTPQIFASVPETATHLKSSSGIDLAVSLTPVTMSLTVDKTALRVGETATYTVQLSSTEPANLAGQTVILKSRPDSFTSTFSTLATGVTDENGMVVLSATFNSVGTPQVFAEFAATRLLARAAQGKDMVITSNR